MSGQQTGRGAPPRHPNDPGDRARPQQSKPAPAPIEEGRRRYLAEQYGFSEAQIDVIRSQVCLSATDEELEFFLATCKRVQLDPFSRQIYFIKRKQRVQNEWGDFSHVEVGRPEVSIDGLRASAERTGEYEGQGEVEWCDAGGKWTTVWLNREAPPTAARSKIFRKGWREPMVTVALYAEYCPVFKGKGSDGDKVPEMWRKMAANQLAKCAEAAGFRRAFPRDMSGLYIAEEMEHTYAGAPSASDFEAPEVIKPSANERPTVAMRALEAPAPGMSLADQISAWRAQLEVAQSRGDLAPVGKVLAAAKADSNPDNDTIVRELAPVFQAKFRALPAAPAKGRA